MAKKDAKKKAVKKSGRDKQQKLLEVDYDDPRLVELAEDYDEKMHARVRALEEERSAKTAVLDYVRELDIKPVDSSGKKIVTLTTYEGEKKRLIVTPRDELVQLKPVKEKRAKDDEDDEDDD